MSHPPIAVDLVGSFFEWLQGVVPESEQLVAAGDVDLPDGAEIVVTFARDRERLAAVLGPDTRWVHILSTGIDGCALDLIPDDVMVTCSRGASSQAISEWVVAMMLAHVKRLPEIWISEPPERWNFASLDTLDGKTIGLVGMGAIATEVARRLAGFDVELVGYRRRPLPSPDPAIELARSLPELLARSDHVVVAAPATPDTYHLVDADALAAIKPGAHVVNIARGTLIDQDALIAALDDGRVARASLDVVDPEPLPAGHPLYHHPLVRVSAHVSWSSPVTMRRTVECFGENVPRYRAGKPLEGVVDLAAGY